MKPETPEALFGGWPQEAAEMVLRLREMVLELCPDALERVYVGWNIVGYSFRKHPTWDMFCYIGFSKGKIALGFNEGIVLPDPHKVLRGKAKRARSLLLKPSEPVPEVARNLINAAYSYALFQRGDVP